MKSYFPGKLRDLLLSSPGFRAMMTATLHSEDLFEEKTRAYLEKKFERMGVAYEKRNWNGKTYADMVQILIETIEDRAV